MDRAICFGCGEADHERCDSVVLSRYSVDREPVLYTGCEDQEFNGSVAHWDYFRDIKPSIHMPRWASRLTLRLREVRVEIKANVDEVLKP